MQNFTYFYLRILPPGASIVKNWVKQSKIKITSSLFISYLHNELQTCRRSWTLPGCKISGILISAFGHQGPRIVKKLKKSKKNENIIFLLIIYWHSELKTYRRSWNLHGCKISGILITAFGHLGALNYQKIEKIKEKWEYHLSC